MKKVLFLIFFIFFLVFGIFFGKSYIDQYQKRQQYEFVLSTADGEINLADFKGKIVAIFFGYMYCPDVCPTALSMLAQSLKGLSQEEIKDFRAIFISVDPQRDGLKALKEYAQYFHPNFIGATGDEKEILRVSKNYGTYFAKEKLSESDVQYGVVHTSYIYLFDKDGNLNAQLKHFVTPSEITQAVKEVFKID